MGKSEKLYNFIVDMMLRETTFGDIIGTNNNIISFIILPNGRKLNLIPIREATTIRLNNYLESLFKLRNPITKEFYVDVQSRERNYGDRFGLTDDETFMVFERYFKRLDEYIFDNYS